MKVLFVNENWHMDMTGAETQNFQIQSLRFINVKKIVSDLHTLLLVIMLHVW
jgi:hypothetical protein